jgi:uncharacterized protein YjbI with pentapeptide repeats
MSSGTPDDPAAPAVPARWPDDPQARRALEDFLRTRADGPATEPFTGVETDLRGAVLDGIALDGAWLNLARLDGVRLRGADLFGAHLNGASLREADLTGALLSKAVLDDADARGAVLDDAELVRVEAIGTDLRGAQLRRTRWAAALVTCDFEGADLTEAVFDRTAADGSRLVGATVTGASGSLFGPIEVDRGSGPLQLDGDELARWFREHGAPGVTVLQPARRR